MAGPSEQEKKYAEIIGKAHADPEFKKKLLANPEATFREFGLEAPKDFKLADKPGQSLSDKDLSKAPRPRVCYITGTGTGGGG